MAAWQMAFWALGGKAGGTVFVVRGGPSVAAGGNNGKQGTVSPLLPFGFEKHSRRFGRSGKAETGSSRAVTLGSRMAFAVSQSFSLVAPSRRDRSGRGPSLFLGRF